MNEEAKKVIKIIKKFLKTITLRIEVNGMVEVISIAPSRDFMLISKFQLPITLQRMKIVKMEVKHLINCVEIFKYGKIVFSSYQLLPYSNENLNHITIGIDNILKKLKPIFKNIYYEQYSISFEIKDGLNITIEHNNDLIDDYLFSDIIVHNYISNTTERIIAKYPLLLFKRTLLNSMNNVELKFNKYEPLEVHYTFSEIYFIYFKISSIII